MPVNKLSELKRGASAAPEDIVIDIEGESSSGAGSASMQQFFKDVELVKKHILVIRNSTKRVAEINQQVVLATTNESENEESRELQLLITDTNKKAAITKQMLKKMNEETESLKVAPGNKQSEVRIRENLSNTLTRKFVDVMKEYQTAQTKYKTDIKKKVKRQVQIIKPDATQEEIDAVLQAGGGSGEIMKAAILKGDAADSIRNAFENVASKYQDVLVLEASVAELHQMFLDFALLTEQQGELLDQIEYQVKSASDYIEEGNKEVAEAIEIQKSIRKKQCCIIITVLVVIGIIAAIIIITQQQQGKLGTPTSSSSAGSTTDSSGTTATSSTTSGARYLLVDFGT